MVFGVCRRNDRVPHKIGQCTYLMFHLGGDHKFKLLPERVNFIITGPYSGVPLNIWVPI